MHHSVKTWHRRGERSSWKADAPRRLVWLKCRCFQLPPIPPWSGTWAAWCACHEPTHLVLGEVLLHGS